MTPDDFASELLTSITHTILAHSKYPKSPKDAIRFWDNVTPYAVHPIWCAMTLLTETALPADIRYNGYQAMLWHDTLEDTNLPLPGDTRDEVRILVEEMTFESFKEEEERIWKCSDTAKLLKLYDKVSVMLDATWMSDEKWNHLVEYTLSLADFASEKFGSLNIVKIARAICKPRKP